MSNAEHGPELTRLLAGWHRDTEAALADLEASPRRDGFLTTEDLNERTKRVQRLRRVMLPRETLKQRYLWPAVKAHVSAGERLVASLTDSKLAMEDTMLKLRWADERSEWIEDLLEQLAERARLHVAVERGALPRLEAELPPAVQARVADRLRRPHGLLPVQPHPDLPAAPWAAAVLAPIVGVLDRIRDAVTTAPG